MREAFGSIQSRRVESESQAVGPAGLSCLPQHASRWERGISVYRMWSCLSGRRRHPHHADWAGNEARAA